MNCEKCPKFDKEVGVCGELPSNLEDVICLLRHIAYTVNDIWQSLPEDDREEGDWWKK